MSGILITDTRGGGPVIGWSDAAAQPGLRAPAARSCRGRPPEPWRTRPAHTSISDFSLQSRKRINFCSFEAPVCGQLSWQPQEYDPLLATTSSGGGEALLNPGGDRGRDGQNKALCSLNPSPLTGHAGPQARPEAGSGHTPPEVSCSCGCREATRPLLAAAPTALPTPLSSHWWEPPPRLPLASCSLWGCVLVLVNGSLAPAPARQHG